MSKNIRICRSKKESYGFRLITLLIAALTISLSAPYITSAQDSDQNSVVDYISNSQSHTMMNQAFLKANLLKRLNGIGPFTVFAPTDKAWDALPEDIVNELLNDPEGKLLKLLMYHILDKKVQSHKLYDGDEYETLLGLNVHISFIGDDVYVNGAKIITKDIHLGNGIVHVIDAVLFPPTIADVIINSEDHTILETALKEANLVEALSTAGSFTVFAPTDAAFEALPNGMIEVLFNDPEGLLTQALSYHVVNDVYMSTDLYDEQMLTSLLGKSLHVTVNSEGIYINNAKVIVADIAAVNGVVHVIDAVLIPDMSTNVDNNLDKSKALSLYPNPARDFIQLSSTIEANGLLEFSIYNIAGVLIDNGNFEVNDGEQLNQRISLQNYTKGIYTISVEIKDEKYVQKFHVLD